MNKYYKAVLCTCDKNLKYLKKGYVNFIDIYDHLIIHNDELIIRVDEEGKSTEFRINEEIPFLNFKNNKEEIKALVPEDYVTTFALSINHELTEENLKDFIAIDGYKLEADIMVAKKVGNENLNKSEAHIKQMQKMMKKFD